MARKKARVSTSTAAAPRRARKLQPRPAKASAASRRDAARRRELARIVRPMVRKYIEEAMEDHIDLLAAERALAEGGEPIPAEEMFRKLGW